MPGVIFEDKRRNLKIQRSSTYTPSFVTFLERTVWGSGGVRYTMPNVADTLKRLKNPHFLSLTENDEIVAVSTLNQKTTHLSGKTYPAVYSYGIAVDAPQRGLGYGTLLATQGLRSRRRTSGGWHGPRRWCSCRIATRREKRPPLGGEKPWGTV